MLILIYMEKPTREKCRSARAPASPGSHIPLCGNADHFRDMLEVSQGEVNSADHRTHSVHLFRLEIESVPSLQ